MSCTLVREFRQRERRSDPRSFVGKGEVEEIRKFLEGRATGIIIFDGELKATQHYQLEKTIGARCMDRIDLILELFARRARTKDSKLRIELARIERELPLLRERISKRKVEECPGFLAGGGYGVNTYYHRTRQGKKRIP